MADGHPCFVPEDVVVTPSLSAALQLATWEDQLEMLYELHGRFLLHSVQHPREQFRHYAKGKVAVLEALIRVSVKQQQRIIGFYRRKGQTEGNNQCDDCCGQ